MHSTRITIGNDPDPTLNAICADNVTDGGWYYCGQVLEGEYIGVYRTDSRSTQYSMWALRAYSGINVLKDATVYSEPEHDVTESASNLIR